MVSGRREDGMVDVFAEWAENAPIDRCGIPERDAAGCSDLFKVRWQESFVAEGGRRLVCHYVAPDAESVRMALRCANIAVGSVWSGTVHRWTGSGKIDPSHGVLLPPLPAGTKRALTTARAAACTGPGELELTRAILSSDGTRLVGVCDAKDRGTSLMPRFIEESRQRQVWRCRRFAAPTGATIQAGLSVLVWSAAHLKQGTYPEGPQAAPSA